MKCDMVVAVIHGGHQDDEIKKLVRIIWDKNDFTKVAVVWLLRQGVPHVSYHGTCV